MEDNNIWTASGDGHIDAVKQFVDSGISVDAKDDTGYTPL
jgi:ankyrin repeat protein